MGRYRKIDVRVWNDAKFRGMSDRGKLAFFFVLTHPNMTSLGAMRATINGLSAEIGWSEKAFREAFQEAKGMCVIDERSCFLWFPNFLKYNGPESPNVVKSWADALDLLPECGMKNQLLRRTQEFTEGLSKGFQEAFMEAFAKSMPNQEQEQEQEQEQKQEQEEKGTAAEKKSLEPLPEVPIAVAEIWSQWLAYKSEARQAYKPLGLRAAISHLSKRVDEIGANAVIQAITVAMASGWKGWDHESTTKPKREDNARDSINGLGDGT